MDTRQSLHAGFERLIGTASVDSAVRRALLRDPWATAMAFGLSDADSALVADIHAADLRAFAAALVPHLYGATHRMRAPQAALRISGPLSPKPGGGSPASGLRRPNATVHVACPGDGRHTSRQ